MAFIVPELPASCRRAINAGFGGPDSYTREIDISNDYCSGRAGMFHPPGSVEVVRSKRQDRSES